MREKPLLLLLLLVPTVSSQLSCHRIPTSFCCTTRIRDQCPDQCATVECGTEFIHSLFSTDGSRKPAGSFPGAHDGNANIGGIGSGDSRGEDQSTVTSFEKPDQPPPAAPTRVGSWSPPNSNFNSNSGDGRIQTTTTPSPSEFPTLIPFSSESSWSTVTQRPLAPSQEETAFKTGPPMRIPEAETSGTTRNPNLATRRDGHRRRTTPDPRIIRPPESLVVIGDYDEDEPPSENAVVDEFQPLLIPTTSPSPFLFQTAPPLPVTPPPPQTPPTSSVVSNSGDVFARSRKEINTDAEQQQQQQSGTAATLRDSSIISSSSSSLLPSVFSYNHRRFSSRSSTSSSGSARGAHHHNRLICRLTQPHARLVCNRPPPTHSVVLRNRSRYVTSPKYWNKIVDVRKSSPKRITMMRGGQRRRNFATNRIHINPFMGELARKRRKLDSGSSHEWKVSIIPRGRGSKPTGVNSIPPFTIDGKADERFNKFYRTIDKVINKLDLTNNNGDPHVREGGEPQIRLEGNTGDLSVDSSAVVIVPRTTVAPGVTNKVSTLVFRPLHFTAPSNGSPPGISPPPRPSPTSSDSSCGVAPDFTPCVSNEIASRSLLECCKRKNLPAGCQHLCRYDVTQAEIRSAMDRGQCGIFNVAPFLECASQGKDNSECCRHRGIIQKTGPQCEQFCRPAQGLSALGVQHIVCGNAVGDMLHCHHSGVRI